MISRVYEAGEKEGKPLDERVVAFIEKMYGDDWNNFLQSAAESISDELLELDDCLGGKGPTIKVGALK